MIHRREPVNTRESRNPAGPRSAGALAIACIAWAGLQGLSHSLPRANPGKEHIALEEDMAVPCTECHGDLIAGAVVHPPAAEGECEACHEMTPAGEEWTVGFAVPEEELCLTCHENPAGPGDSASIHPPAAEGACAFCHNPHSSPRPHLFREEGSNVCLDCHGEQQEEMGLSHVHGVIQTLGCQSCHNPHASANPRLLHQSGNGLCLECHSGTSPGRARNEEGQVILFATHPIDSEVFDRIPKLRLPPGDRIGHPVQKHPVEGERDPRSPEKPFGCRSCHEPHGSDREALLVGGEGFGLCRQCHKK